MRIWTVILVGGTLSFTAACEPSPGVDQGDSSSVVITDSVAETVAPEVVEVMPVELVTAAYSGRLEFRDAMGLMIKKDAPLSLGLLDQLRGMSFSAAGVNAVLTQASDVMDMSEVAEVRGYSEIVGLAEGQSDPREGEVLHSGLVFVKRGDQLMGMTHTLNWDATNEMIEITATPVGFTPSDITIMTHGNVREDVMSNDLKPLVGTWDDDTYTVMNGRGGDEAYQYTIIRVTDPATGNVLDFNGPDNFQTYR